jgi:hypothetical protein
MDGFELLEGPKLVSVVAGGCRLGDDVWNPNRGVTWS